MKAYLDYNIFTSIEDGIFGIDKILNLDSSINEFPYSASHIQEADNITSSSDQQRNLYINRRLKTIGEISNSLYIYHELANNKIHFFKENPDTVLETIRDVPSAKMAMQGFMNLLSSQQKEELRIALGIDSKQLNNYSPNEVINQLNKSLTNWGTDDTFLDLLEKATAATTYNGLHNRIAGVYEFLDLCGYWKDKETSTSNYARLWDASHAHYASHCDYFITDDKRNRNKVKVVYDLFNIKTKVLSSNGE